MYDTLHKIGQQPGGGSYIFKVWTQILLHFLRREPWLSKFDKCNATSRESTLTARHPVLASPGVPSPWSLCNLSAAYRHSHVAIHRWECLACGPRSWWQLARLRAHPGSQGLEQRAGPLHPRKALGRLCTSSRWMNVACFVRQRIVPTTSKSPRPELARKGLTLQACYHQNLLQ
jgi:hypothetical protein